MVRIETAWMPVWVNPAHILTIEPTSTTNVADLYGASGVRLNGCRITLVGGREIDATDPIEQVVEAVT